MAGLACSHLGLQGESKHEIGFLITGIGHHLTEDRQGEVVGDLNVFRGFEGKIGNRKT